MNTNTYQIMGMDCANCAKKLEKGVGRLEGIQTVQIDFATGKMHIEGNVLGDQLKQRVEALGYGMVAPDDQAVKVNAKKGGVVGFVAYLLGQDATRMALIGGGMILGVLLAMLVGLSAGIGNVLFVVSMGITAYPIAKSGVINLLINRDFNIDLLMTIAAIGAVIIGEYLEAATVIFLFAIGESLEGYAADRARDSIRSLMEIAPPQAVLLENGKESVVPVEILKVGDVIVVKPGDRIAMDGVIVSGSSEINQSTLTGESLPVFKEKGAEVFAGTINESGALEIQVTSLVEDNTINRIIQLVEAAQSVRAPSQRMIDQFARWYTPSIVVLALLIATIPPLVFGAPFWDTSSTHGWFYRALALLVIACPCALVISAPVTIISAITMGTRRGVLIKGGAHLEALAQVKAFAFDKTGTLTAGKPVVVDNRSDLCVAEDACEYCDDVLALAAAVEQRSSHPLAQAVVQAASARGVASVYAPAEDVALLPGKGVQGRVAERFITIGSHRLFDEEYNHSERIHQLANDAEAQGQTTMLLRDDDKVLGYIAFSDAVREESKAVVAEVKALGGITVMLTGDHQRVAENVGANVGVDEVRSELLPADKVDAVKALLLQHKSVAMVGDGVNDAPALATATVGIAMGDVGSAQAMETADLVLVGDDLRQLPFAIKLARFARGIIRQNVLLSLAVKVAFMLLAIFGAATLWMAILADVGMSLLVTLNGMRPLRFNR